MKHSTVYDCNIISLPKIYSPAGNITAVNNGIEIAFKTKRVFYLYDIPGGEGRGAHGHRELHQLIIAASGSFDFIVDDSLIKRTMHLAQPYFGLYVPPGLWGELDNFSSGSICLVLASEEYKESDYLRNYVEFYNWKRSQG